MTTYNTGASVPSVDVRDLYDNAENLDNFSNGAALAYTDRKGVSRQSLAGIRAASSYQHLGAYGAGLVFTSYNQTFSYLGEFYAPSAGVTLPYTTTGVGAAEIATFRSVGDAVLRGDLASSNGSTLVFDGPISVHDSLAPLRSVVSVERFRTPGLSDSNTIRAALEFINSNISPLPSKLVFEASRVYTYDRTASLLNIEDISIDLNGAYLFRAPASSIKTTLAASAGIGQSTITLSSIPSNWEVGDYLTAYSDNTDANTSRNPVRINSINIGASTVTMASGFGAFGAFAATIPSGTTVAKSFSAFAGRPSSTDTGTDLTAGVNANVHIYGGKLSGNSAAQNNNSWRYSTEILLHSRGGSIHDIEFINVAGECIVGHGLRVHDCNFSTLYGSAFHTSMNDDTLPQSSCSWFERNFVKDVNLATNTVNGHSEGAITFSWGAGNLTVQNNDFRNGSESILGAFGPSSGANLDEWLHFNNNTCRNFVRVFYGITGPVEGVHVHGNILSFCGDSRFQMEELQVGARNTVGDNIEIGDTVLVGVARSRTAAFGDDLGNTIKQNKITVRANKLLSNYSRMSDCVSLTEATNIELGMLCSDTGYACNVYHTPSGTPAGEFFAGWYPATKTYKFFQNGIAGSYVDLAVGLKLSGIKVFADNAAAASLPAGAVYRTATGVLMVKY